MFKNIERNGILKNGFQILDPSNRLEFWFIVWESNLIVTPKTPEMCRVNYTKNDVKYTKIGKVFKNIERNGILKNGFHILDPPNRLEFWILVWESNFIVTPKTPELCRVNYSKKEFTVFCVAYTLAELALTEVVLPKNF